MGLIISRSIYLDDGEQIDSFYSRVENIRYYRTEGILSVVSNFYRTKEGAKNTYPEYINDSLSTGSNSDIIPTVFGFQSGSYNNELPLYVNYFLTSSVQVEESGSMVTKYVVNKPYTGSFYKIAYENYKKTISDFFGSGNVIGDE